MGMQEMVLIFGVLLLLFGGSKLPQLASGMGQALREFKRAATSTDEDKTLVLPEPEVMPARRP